MYNFDEYIRQVEPDKKEKAIIWQTAIGLQQTDGLKPSEYLIQTAIENIEGNITFEEVKNRLDIYYKTARSRQTDANDTEKLRAKGRNVTDVTDGVTDKLGANVPVNGEKFLVKEENVPVKIDINTMEKVVLDLLKTNPKITYEQIAEIINKNRKTVQRTINSLKKRGIISRVGSDKTGCWVVNGG